MMILKGIGGGDVQR